LLSDWRTN
jgi:hypothetical protein